jgi:hypothetical protein
MSELRVGFAQVSIIRDGRRFSKTVYVKETVDPKTGAPKAREAIVFEDSGSTAADNYGPQGHIKPSESQRGKVIDIFC